MQTKTSMTIQSNTRVIYSHDTLEFVTVAAEFCAFLEQSEGREKRLFVETMLKLLPLLYLKARLLPELESNDGFLPDARVTEEDYNYICGVVRTLLGDDDMYEDLVYDNGTMSDELQWRTVSENLADMYQSLRNFVSAYQQGIEDCMAGALWEVREEFALTWGKCLVDSLRQLHLISHKIIHGEEDENDF